MGVNAASRVNMGTLIHSVQETLANSIESISLINSDLKVLAINAKIQAARAGAVGAGFSVVADEMDKLSSHTVAIIDSLSGNVKSAVQSLIGLESQTRGRRLSQMASTCIDLVDRNLYERSCNVRWWATDSAVVAALTEPDDKKLQFASERLGVILESYTVYFDLVLCDLDGTILCNGRPDQYRCTGQNVGQYEWFKQAVKSSSGSEYGFEGPLKTDLAQGQNILVYSCGVRAGGHARGKLLGVFGVLFNWDGLGLEMLHQAEATLAQETENQVAAFLCRPDGTVVSPVNTEGRAKKIALPALDEISPDGFKEQKERGKSISLTGTAVSRGFKTYKTGWIAVITESVGNI
jgi:hypothetical protein